MSSFNSIEKFVYKKHSEDPVSLIEYIVFANDSNQEKYALLKFRNNLNQIVRYFKFNVFQYDENNVLLEKSLIQYDRFSANPQDEFVPNSKIALNYACAKIEVNLEYACFEQLTWENNEFSVIPYSRKEFENEFTEKNKSLETRVDKTETKKTKHVKERASKAKRKTKVKNIIKMNITKASKRIAILLSLLLMVGIVFAVYGVRDEIDTFSDANFEYYKDASGNVVIDKYIGDDDSVIIPYFVGGLKIVSIEDGAFEEAKITSVTSYAKNLTIGEEAFINCTRLKEFVDKGSVYLIKSSAFEGCTNLKEVTVTGPASIYKYAFRDCSNLRLFNGEETFISQQAFLNCSKLEEFNFGSTSAIRFATFFTEEGEMPESNIISVATKQRQIGVDFFEGFKSINQIELLNDEVSVEYGALKHLSLGKEYFYNDVFESLNNEIISMNPNTSKLIIESSMSKNEVEEIINSVNKTHIKELSIDSAYVKVNDDFIKGFSNLEKLIIGSESSFDIVRANSLPSRLKSISVFSLTDGVVDVISNSKINELAYYGSSKINASTFANLKNLEKLEISSNCSGISNDTFTGLTKLRELKLPNVNGKTLEQLGVNKNLSALEILSYDGVYSIDVNYLTGYNNLTEITISAELDILPQNFVSELPSLTKLAITGKIAKLEEKAIGTGCFSLNDVTLPYLGESKTAPCAYSSLNASYESTRSLTIANDTRLTENCLDGLTSLDKLIFTGSVINVPNGCFSSINNVDYFEINTEYSVRLSKMFNTNVYINTFVISTNTVQGNIVQNATVNNFVIKDATHILTNAFVSLGRFEVVYICDDISTDSTDYTALAENANYILFAGENKAENATCLTAEYVKYDELNNYIPNIK